LDLETKFRAIGGLRPARWLLLTTSPYRPILNRR
jgi:hypothetical protein